MDFNADVHSIQCPKCGHGMEEVTYGQVTIDRCTNCQGLWFDTGEAEQLKDQWMGDALDLGLSLIHISEPTRPPLLSRMPSSA